MIQNSSVQKVVHYLSVNGHPGQVITLKESARSAEEAAKALHVELGAIVKTLIFTIEIDNKKMPIASLIAGDRKCNTQVLGQLLGVKGRCMRPNADEVKKFTGYSIGGVSPIGIPSSLTIFMDESLNRFETVWSAAGHPNCVFPASFSELQQLTKAQVNREMSIPLFVE